MTDATMISRVTLSGAALCATASEIYKFSKKIRNAPKVWGQYSEAIETLKPIHQVLEDLVTGINVILSNGFQKELLRQIKTCLADLRKVIDGANKLLLKYSGVKQPQIFPKLDEQFLQESVRPRRPWEGFKEDSAEFYRYLAKIIKRSGYRCRFVIDEDEIRQHIQSVEAAKSLLLLVISGATFVRVASSNVKADIQKIDIKIAEQNKILDKICEQIEQKLMQRPSSQIGLGSQQPSQSSLTLHSIAETGSVNIQDFARSLFGATRPSLPVETNLRTTNSTCAEGLTGVCTSAEQQDAQKNITEPTCDASAGGYSNDMPTDQETDHAIRISKTFETDADADNFQVHTRNSQHAILSPNNNDSIPESGVGNHASRPMITELDSNNTATALVNEVPAEETGNSEVDSACRDSRMHSDTTEPLSVPINVQGHLKLDNVEFIKEPVIPKQGGSNYLNHPIFCIDRLFGSTACLALSLKQPCRIQQCEHSTLHGLEVEDIDNAFPNNFCICLSKVRTGWMSSLEEIIPEAGHDFLLIDKCSRVCKHTVVELSEPRMLKCMLAHHFRTSVHQVGNCSSVASKEDQGSDSCQQYFEESEEAISDNASAKSSIGYPFGKESLFKNRVFGSRSSSSVSSFSPRLSIRTRRSGQTQIELSDMSRRSSSESYISSLRGDELPWGIVNFKLSETKGFITQNDELVESLRRELSTIHHLTNPTKDEDTQNSLWAEGTWFDSVVHSDATFVVFQRPDDWIHLTIVSHEKPDQLLSLPFTKAIPNTPLHAEGTNVEHNAIRIFFFRHGQNGPVLTIGMLHLDQEEGHFFWDLQDLCDPCTLPHPITGINFFKLSRGVLGYACLDGLLIVGESDNGTWSRVKYNRNIRVNKGNQIISSALPPDSPISLLRIDRHVCELFEFVQVHNWSDLYVKDDVFNEVRFSTKKLNWEGLKINESSQILAIAGKTKSHAGIFCKDANNDVYLLQGRPWEDEFGCPYKVCTTKPGTNMSLTSDSTLLFFISTDNEVKKLELELTELDAITITGPHQVFTGSPSWTEVIGTTVAAIQAMDPDKISRSVSSYSGSSSSSRSWNTRVTGRSVR